MYSQVLHDVARRIDLAFRAFFRRVEQGEKPGYPRFKGDGYDSFCYPQSGFRFCNGKLRLSNPEKERLGQVQSSLRASLGDEAYLSAHDAGRAMSRDEVCVFVLEA